MQLFGLILRDFVIAFQEATVKLKGNLYYFLICFVITMEFAEMRIKQIRASLSKKCFLRKK